MATLTVGAAYAMDVDAVGPTNFSAPSSGAPPGSYASAPNATTRDIIYGSLQYDTQGVFTGGLVTAFERYVSGSLIFRIADISVQTAASDVWFGADLPLSSLLSANDVINGGTAADILYGYDGADVINGGAGDDILLAGYGYDVLTGGPGADRLIGAGVPGITLTARYSGQAADYSTSKNGDGSWTVRDLRAGSPDGTDVLINIAVVSYADRAILLDPSPNVAALYTAGQNILRADVKSLSGKLDFLEMVWQVGNGGAMADAVAQLVAGAREATSVATLTYQFFTGKIPSVGGLDFLVSPTGPNANNINSAYYQAFNLENRYINFAVNLGKVGEGAAAFNAAYGSQTLFDATRSAYTTIFGAAPTDAKVHALIDSRVSYFAAYGGDGANGIGTKAAMVGWLLAEAVKADVGMYAKSNDALLTDLADGATLAVNLVGVYGHPEYAFGG
ncbi:MAG: hypothetical protein ABIO39_05725 [Caulobacteraceae bacterium]